MEARQLTPADYDEALATKITSLCGNIYAATCQLLELVREFDQRKGWADIGAYDCAHWLSITCGMGMNSAREKVRVANALAELPLISAAFKRGEVSYSKVRAMTRVATAETEEELLAFARDSTASQMEKLVRQYRRVNDSEERTLAQQAFARREVRPFYDDNGLAGIIVRLPGDYVAKAMEAINQIMVEGWKADRSIHRDRGVEDDTENSAETNKTDSGVSAESSDGKNETESSVSAESLDNEAVTNAAAEADIEAEIKTESNVSAETVSVGHVIRNTDPVQGAVLVRDPINAQRADAFMTLIDAVLAGKLELDPAPDRAQIIVHVDVDALSGRDCQGDCNLEHGERICTDVARRMSCDGSVVKILEKDGEPLNIGRKTRTIPPGLRRALECRDRGCRFPGCNRYYHTDGHHIEHWANGGETSLHNLVLLCRFHHRLFHEEGFSVTREAGGKLIFRNPRGEILRDSYVTRADGSLLDNVLLNCA